MIRLPVQNGIGNLITMQTRSLMITSYLKSEKDMGSEKQRAETPA